MLNLPEKKATLIAEKCVKIWNEKEELHISLEHTYFILIGIF